MFYFYLSGHDLCVFCFFACLLYMELVTSVFIFFFLLPVICHWRNYPHAFECAKNEPFNQPAKHPFSFEDLYDFCCQAGTATDEIDQAVHQMIIDNGAYPSPLGYGGFPKSVCTSVNECICHGIPDSRLLEVHPVQ